MKTISICIIAFLLFNCNQSRNQNQQKTPAELRYELQSKEEAYPLNYIALSDVTMTAQQKKVRNSTIFRKAKYKPDGVLIEGFVVNKASIATFKDVKVQISYYSKTKSIIYQKTFVLYEFYKPGSRLYFSLKDYPVEGYTSFHAEVVSAVAN